MFIKQIKKIIYIAVIFFILHLPSVIAVNERIQTYGYWKPGGPGSEFWPFITTPFPGFGTEQQQNDPKSNPDVFCKSQGKGWRLPSAGDVTFDSRRVLPGFNSYSFNGQLPLFVGDNGNQLPGHPSLYYKAPYTPENRIPVPSSRPSGLELKDVLGTLQDHRFYTTLVDENLVTSFNIGTFSGFTQEFLMADLKALGFSFWITEVSGNTINPSITNQAPSRGVFDYIKSSGTSSILFGKPDVLRFVYCVKDI